MTRGGADEGRPISPDLFVEAGLYDPAAPDATARLALLEYLAGRGAEIERMVRADAEGDLIAVGLECCSSRVT